MLPRRSAGGLDTKRQLSEQCAVDNQTLADELELLALEEAIASLGASHLLVIAAAAIRAQSDEIMMLMRERDQLLEDVASKKR